MIQSCMNKLTGGIYMSDYIIATSSTCDLPRTYLDEHTIPFISYSVTVNGELR